MNHKKISWSLFLVIGMILTFSSALANGPAHAETAKPEQAPAEPAAVEIKPKEATAAPEPAKSTLVTTFLWITFVLGLWLLISPWLIPGEKPSLKWSTSITGLIVAGLSVIAALS
ncbi:MAG: SPW repeat protein [Thermodesulfobacteriota bacterium]